MTASKATPVYWSCCEDDKGFVAFWIGKAPVWRGEWIEPTYGYRPRVGYSFKQLLHNAVDHYLKGAAFELHELAQGFAQAALYHNDWPPMPSPPDSSWPSGAEPKVPRRTKEPTGESWWTVLGVKRRATLSEVKAAFRRLARETHPDQGGDAGAFIRVKAAYDIARGVLG